MDALQSIQSNYYLDSNKPCYQTAEERFIIMKINFELDQHDPRVFFNSFIVRK